MKNYGTLNETKVNIDYGTAKNLRDVYLNSSIAVVWNCEEAQDIINTIEPVAATNLHIMKERVGAFPLVYVESAFPYPRVLYKILIGYYESGIAQWLDHMEEWLQIFKFMIRISMRQNSFQALKIENLQVAFHILFWGELVAIFIFLFEIMYSRWVPNNPNIL